MKIRIPVKQIVGLLGKLVKAAPGGISKEEAQALGAELLDIALAILGTSLPEHVEVG